MSEHQPPHSIDTVDTKNSTIEERHPDWPKLDVLFYLGPHGHADNFEEVPILIAETDIYLYESLKNTDSFRRDLQSVADHPYNTLEQTIEQSGIRGDILEQIVRGIYSTGKAISSIDIPNEPPYYSFIADFLYTQQNNKLPIEDTFEDSVVALDEQAVAHAEMQNQREKMMVGRFEEKIEELLNERPELKEKDGLRILLTMGSYHTTLRHALSESGVPSNRQFSTPTPYVYAYNTELERTHAYHKEPSHELLERAWIEVVINNIIREVVGKEQALIYTDSLYLYGRNIVSRLEHDQREQIYERLYNEAGDSTQGERHHSINQVLKSSGIDTIPDTSEEILEKLQATERLSLKGLAGHVHRFRSTSP